ncbi:MAG: bacteriocin production protein [Kangiellaceae bacterium]|jgi:membrane protein required for colicin V production|nr:bacteriocin production protein [Kangiellaceae bacterium]|tara:strand:+ start:1974 stop:2495 length:522 start_codon:yes stop_codon:yes gene_type:complete
MTWLDYAILTVIAVSTVISLFRGFVKEALSLVGWFAAFVVSRTFYQPLADIYFPGLDRESLAFLTQYVDQQIMANGLAIFTLFVLTLIVFSIVNVLISKLVAKTGLSGLDRLLGMIFGAVRGVLIITAITLVMVIFTRFPEQAWWQDSILVEHFVLVGEWLFSFVSLENTPAK